MVDKILVFPRYSSMFLTNYTVAKDELLFYFYHK
jgi:hypothetical protein